MAIARPLRRNLFAAVSRNSLISSSGPIFFAGARVGQVKMEILIPELAASVGGVAIFPSGDMPFVTVTYSSGPYS